MRPDQWVGMKMQLHTSDLQRLALLPITERADVDICRAPGEQQHRQEVSQFVYQDSNGSDGEQQEKIECYEEGLDQGFKWVKLGENSQACLSETFSSQIYDSLRTKNKPRSIQGAECAGLGYA